MSLLPFDFADAFAAVTFQLFGDFDEAENVLLHLPLASSSSPLEPAARPRDIGEGQRVVEDLRISDMT